MTLRDRSRLEHLASELTAAERMIVSLRNWKKGPGDDKPLSLFRGAVRPGEEARLGWLDGLVSHANWELAVLIISTRQSLELAELRSRILTITLIRNGGRTDKLARSLESQLGVEVQELWAHLRGYECTADCIAAELGGEDPLHAESRERLVDAKGRVQAIRAAWPSPRRRPRLNEPSDELLEQLWTVVDPESDGF